MRRIVPLIGCLLVACCVTAARGDAGVDELLGRLSHPDPKVREEIAKQIVSLGASARPALIEASRSRDARLAGRAAEMLMKLPFFRADDPAPVRRILADYHTKSSEERLRILMSELPPMKDAPTIILRIFQEDPDPLVAWGIGEFYSGQPDDFWKPLMNADLSDARPAMMETVARGHFFVDRPRALELLGRVIAEEEQYPSAPNEQSRRMLELMAADAQVKGNLGEAQKWRRRLATLPAPAMRMMVEDEAALETPRLFSLLSFYAGTGPIAGLGDDLVQYREELIEPENLFALAQVMDIPAFSEVSAALRHLGMMSLGAEIPDRIRVGNLVAQQQWVWATRAIFAAVLKDSSENHNDPVWHEFHARRMLYLLAREIGDDTDAIRQTEEEIKIYERNNLGDAVSALNARLEAHRLRQARLAKDRKQVEKSVELLNGMSGLDEADADVGIDWINALKELGETEKAKSVFETFYQQHVAMMTTTQGSAASLNNIAWLCAGVGMKTDFALEAAQRAIRAEPTNYGYIDTAAEACYATGQYDRAVELETFALALRPGDQFLLKQLEKFKAGKKR